MTLKDRIAALAALGRYIRERPEHLDAYVQRSAHHNPWFTPENQWRMLEHIASAYLDEDLLHAWAEQHGIGDREPKAMVGIVMAGNIPLVGFHDWLSVLLAGFTAQIKLSDKDPYVLTHLVQKLKEFNAEFGERSSFVDRLQGYDAVIATGSDNTGRYFREYFKDVPHIIRGNRSSVAVLHGSETEEELRLLSDDVFAFFGLGCRSVSKVYVPEHYAIEAFLDALHEHRQLANHSKWKNNYDYNYALYTVNRQPFLMTGAMLLREAPELQSRLATLHYERYQSKEELASHLNAMQLQLQQVVSKEPLPGIETVLPGAGQRPGLDDWADGIDIVSWLKNLN